MLDSLPVAIYQVNARGVLTMVRGTFIPESTYELIGKPVSESLDSFPQLVEAVDLALSGHDQAFSASRGGRSFEFLLTGMVEETGDRGVLGVCIEVTEQRRVAAAMADTEEKSKFLANVSHELRTPLNSLLGFADLLGKSASPKLNEREQRFLSNIAKSAQHLVQLVDQLLGLSRLESVGPRLHAEPVDVEEVIEEVIERMLPLANNRNIHLAAGRRVNQRIESDRLALVQILLNLVSNAVKFTPAGGRVRVASHVRSDWLLILVRDNGIGIDSEHQEQIFQEFFQVPCSDPAVPVGSGLGLALSRKLARALGGDLFVHSRADVGSTFELRLPRIDSSSVS